MRDLNNMDPERRATIRFGRMFDWAIGATIMVIAVVFIFMLQSLPQRATFFPWFITISILIVGTTYGVAKLRNQGRWDPQYDPDVELEQGEEHDAGPPFLVPNRRGIARSFSVFFALVLAVIAIGSEFAVPIFITLSLWLSGENKIGAVLSGLGFWVIIHFVFGDFMSINLPVGYLTSALGF